jgi:hypothetical protein
LKSSYSASLSEHLTYRDFLLGVLTFGSMYCSNFALKFVNYPFVVLSKSAKIMPGNNYFLFKHLVIIVGSIRKIYKLHAVQYVLATLITVGLVLFNFSKVMINLSYNLAEKPRDR